MNCQDRVFPSWDRRGGCASKKKARSLRSGAGGVVIMVNVDVVTLSGTDHPVCALIRRLRSIFFTAQPPLLSELCGSHKFFTGHRGCVFVDCPKCESAGKSLARRRSVEFKAPSTASRSCRGRDCRGECVNCWTGARRKES